MKNDFFAHPQVVLTPNKMQLKVKLLNSLQNLNVPENISELSVRQLKELISSSFGEGLDGMRLVVKGRILQDDDSDLAQYNIENDTVVYVARTKSSTSPVKSTSREGAGKTSAYGYIINN